MPTDETLKRLTVEFKNKRSAGEKIFFLLAKHKQMRGYEIAARTGITTISMAARQANKTLKSHGLRIVYAPSDQGGLCWQIADDTKGILA